MLRENISETTRSVKRKRRTIPDGMRLTITEVRGFPRRTRGPDKNLLFKIKRRYIKYIAACPYLNSNEKFVIIKVAEWFNLKDGFTRAAYVTLAESIGVSTATVKRALRTAYDAGLIGIKSGGPSRKGSFGPVANKYVLAFRLVINDASGLLIENAPYHFLPRTVNGEAKSVGQKPVGQIDPIVKTLTVNVEAKSLGQIDPLHANVGGAPAPLPASADAAASASPRPKEESEILPPDSENVKVKFVQFAALASHRSDDMAPDHLIEILDDATEDGVSERYANVEFLRSWCENGSIDTRLPDHGTPYAHIILHGNKSPMTCTLGKAGTLKGWWEADSWVALEYRT